MCYPVGPLSLRPSTAQSHNPALPRRAIGLQHMLCLRRSQPTPSSPFSACLHLSCSQHVWPVNTSKLITVVTICNALLILSLGDLTAAAAPFRCCSCLDDAMLKDAVATNGQLPRHHMICSRCLDPVSNQQQVSHMAAHDRTSAVEWHQEPVVAACLTCEHATAGVCYTMKDAPEQCNKSKRAIQRPSRL
jgi:hypothetical protein